MRFRTLALVIAMGCSLATGAVARKKTSHNAAVATRKSKVKRLRQQSVNRKVKPHKAAKHKTAHR